MPRIHIQYNGKVVCIFFYYSPFPILVQPLTVKSRLREIVWNYKLISVIPFKILLQCTPLFNGNLQDYSYVVYVQYKVPGYSYNSMQAPQEQGKSTSS